MKSTDPHRKTLSGLEAAVQELHALRYKAAMGKVRGFWAEVYVADKLKGITELVGVSNIQVGGGDVSFKLQGKQKRIEVKANDGSRAEQARFAWSFTKKQGKELPFDYAALVGFDRNVPLKIEEEFLITKQEIVAFGGLRNKDYSTGYGISFFSNPDQARYRLDKALSKREVGMSLL